MKEKIFVSIFILFSAMIFALTLRGNPGNPTSGQLNSLSWKDDGPFELSPERGRFALLYSIVEDHSFHFSLPIAHFTTPDLGYIHGKYVSLFAPGVSYLLIPGYIIGKYFGSSQVGTYAVVSFFALINGLLIYSISKSFGARSIPAVLGAMTFLFASPAFAYGVSLYQHHISTFLVLASLATLLATQSFWSTAVIWFLCAWSIPIDYPNAFLMAPIGLYALSRIVYVIDIKNTIVLRFHALAMLTFLTVIIPFLFFIWFNTHSYRNPLQFSGTIQAVKEIDAKGMPTKSTLDRVDTPSPTQKQEKSAVRFFQTRNMLNGMYIHLFSPDRGIIYYTPIMLLALFGIMYAYKKNKAVFVVMTEVVAVCVTLYSMWGDPWGGWAFGSRYMIPVYSLLSILIALAIQQHGKRVAFVLLLCVMFAYSTGVNALGAITSNRNPPQVEVLSLEAQSGKQEKYTPARNWDLLIGGQSKSFVYKQYASQYMTPHTYYIILVGILTGVFASLLLYWFIWKKNHET